MISFELDRIERIFYSLFVIIFNRKIYWIMWKLMANSKNSLRHFIGLGPVRNQLMYVFNSIRLFLLEQKVPMSIVIGRISMKEFDLNVCRTVQNQYVHRCSLCFKPLVSYLIWSIWLIKGYLGWLMQPTLMTLQCRILYT